MGASQIEHKLNECNLAYDLNPTPKRNYYNTFDDEEDGITVVASNKSSGDSEFQLQKKMESVECRDDHDTWETTMTKEQMVEAPVFPTRQHVWAKTVQMERLKSSKHAETMFDTSSIKIVMGQAITDASAT